MTHADLAAAPNLAAYLSLLDDFAAGSDQDIEERLLDALDDAWAKLSSAEREFVRTALAAAKAAADQ